VGYLPENATVAQWVAAFAEIVAATQPRIVLPCDDMAFRLLANLRRSPPRERSLKRTAALLSVAE